MLCDKVKEIAGSSAIIYTAVVGETNFRPRVEDTVKKMITTLPQVEDEESKSSLLATMLGLGGAMATETALVSTFVYGLATENYLIAAIAPAIKLAGNGIAYLSKR